MSSALIIAEPLGCLYTATCVPTGKVYVGITTKGMEERRRMHLKNAKEGLPYHFYRSVRKHGEDAFVWDVVEDGLPWDDLCKLERGMISMLRLLRVKLYNMTDGGDGTTGWKLTPEISAKMSASAKARHTQIKWTDEMRASMAERAKKNKLSPEARSKISEKMKGVKKSPETVEKMRAARMRQLGRGL